jgi:leader peptidase (prepilin peptidase)/N-methyltransferase
VTAALAAMIAAPGLALGSFLNVIVARVPVGRQIVAGRSACMSCGHEIAAYDNIPIVSWLALRGRCRHCRSEIPIRYPAVEVVTALLLVACVIRFGLTAEAVVAGGFCVVLVVISAIDVEHRIVPNKIVLPSAGVVLVAQTLLHPSLEWVLAALGASGILLVAALAYPRGLGMGDVKLALLLGAMLGRNVTVALMIGCLSTLVPAVVLAARHGSKVRKMAIPFAPFLALGGVLGLFAGGAIVDAYLGLF